jgi:hypothetical protein
MLAGLMSGCANQAVEPAVAVSPGDECVAAEFSRTIEPDHCHQQGHEHFSEAASVFGYLIFRIVVEGIVHAIVYH